MTPEEIEARNRIGAGPSLAAMPGLEYLRPFVRQTCGKPFRLASIAGGAMENCAREPGHEGACGPWGSLLK